MGAVKNLSWTPRRRGDIFCAPACGFDCTFAAYEAAVSMSDTIASLFGHGWRGHVWENLGWHWCIVAPNRRASISPSIHKGKIDGWAAYISATPGEGVAGGRWVAHGKNPKAALVAALEKAQDDYREVKAACDDVEPWVGQ